MNNPINEYITCFLIDVASYFYVDFQKIGEKNASFYYDFGGSYGKCHMLTEYCWGNSVNKGIIK